MPHTLFLRGDGLQRRRFPGRDKSSLAGADVFPRRRAQPVEGPHGGHGLFTGADTDGLRKREAPRLYSAAHVGAGIDLIFAFLQNPGGAETAASAVVIGGEQGERYVKAKRLGLTRREQGGF